MRTTDLWHRTKKQNIVRLHFFLQLLHLYKYKHYGFPSLYLSESLKHYPDTKKSPRDENI